MAKFVYHEGKLIPGKDWDYVTKRPKVKSNKKAEVIVAEPELQAEEITSETPEII
jgi:hypothetical protein